VQSFLDSFRDSGSLSSYSRNKQPNPKILPTRFNDRITINVRAAHRERNASRFRKSFEGATKLRHWDIQLGPSQKYAVLAPGLTSGAGRGTLFGRRYWTTGALSGSMRRASAWARAACLASVWALARAA
jgi:hypothetical protein